MIFRLFKKLQSRQSSAVDYVQVPESESEKKHADPRTVSPSSSPDPISRGVREFETVEELYEKLEEVSYQDYVTNTGEHVYVVGESFSYLRYNPCPQCKYTEYVKSLRDFEPQTTDNPLVKSEIAKALADRVRTEIGTAPRDDREFRNWLEKLVTLLDQYLEYDSVHANASRNWRSLAYTYMSADEALRLGRGICGELSLALVSVLRYLGVPASLYRPYFSHIAVVVENPSTGTKYIVDITSGTVETYPSKTLLRKAKTSKSKYFYGPVRLEEFYETTISKRRRLGEEYIGKDFTAEEAIDYEYARHCLQPPYGTERGKKFLEYLTKIGYCKKIFSDKERVEAQMFARIVASCPRPEDPNVPLEEKVRCYEDAWRRFESQYEKMRKLLEQLLRKK